MAALGHLNPLAALIAGASGGSAGQLGMKAWWTPVIPAVLVIVFSSAGWAAKKADR